MIDKQKLRALSKFDDVEELKNAACQIENSREFKIWLSVWNSRMSYQIFLENNRSVKLNFKKLNSVNLFIIKNTDRWRKQKKLVKDIHNVISSGFSYQDHLIARKYNDKSHDQDPYAFFRYLRNFIIHENAFSLVTKLENRSIFQAMNKGPFIAYLQSKLNTNIENNTKRDQKERKKLEGVLKYTINLPEVFNFEEIYNSYQENIIGLHYRYIKKVVKANLSSLKNLHLRAEAHEMRCSNYHQNSNISISDISSLLNSYQIRYLRILIKKSWK